MGTVPQLLSLYRLELRLDRGDARLLAAMDGLRRDSLVVADGDTLARQSRLPVRKVARHIANLERLGYIRLEDLVTYSLEGWDEVLQALVTNLDAGRPAGQGLDDFRALLSGGRTTSWEPVEVPLTALVDRRLELAEASDRRAGLIVRTDSGLAARLVDLPADDAYAVTAEGSWALCVRRRRFGWATAAEDPRSGRSVAFYSTGWAPGAGRVKTEDAQYRLRSAIGRKRWTLSGRAGQKVATFHSNAGVGDQDRLGRISLRINDGAGGIPCAALLVLFSAWTITLEDTTGYGGGQSGGLFFG
jgi:hypothetical protein